MNIKKIKIYVISIFLFVFFNISSTIFAFGATNFPSEYGTTTSNVNFRKSANIESSNVISTLKKGTNLRIIGSIDNFYIVQLQDNKVGVVSKDYININEKKENYLDYTNLEKYYVTVKSNSTNLRGGPGTNFQVYSKLSKDEKLEIIGKINNFLLAITNNNTIGMIREDLVTKDFNISNETINSYTNRLLTLINSEREKAGLNKLELLPNLTKLATLKSEDMVKNDYFSHESPTYGNPFTMMQNFGITYKTAGENIAGNSTIKGAFGSWINSDTHKKNILSSTYNYVGIGITPSQKYGFVIVVMFIRKIARI